MIAWEWTFENTKAPTFWVLLNIVKQNIELIDLVLYFLLNPYR